ncbi:4'-phosphopantetheinyl transferase [Stipitochalara longipes BDJ]|nr:4'-phosphopantetheinyl transferase [Stipitochalara longipes BDJ]
MVTTDSEPFSPTVVQWLLDTRPLWPVSGKLKFKEEVEELKTVASRALSFLSESEKASVLRYYHLKDAKMSLASHLLKHLVITKYCNVPWSQSTISRDTNGKPCFIPTGATKPVTMDFNVSHQAGIVSLIASIGFDVKVDVGTDVVCANERELHDYAHIEKQGFFDWVDMHGDVFAESELNYMKLSPVLLNDEIPTERLSGYARDAVSRCQWRNAKLNLKIAATDGQESTVQVNSNIVVDKKLRRFYAMWCLREAYVKMTGEALLAPWLKDLEISEAQAPDAATDMQDSNSLTRGEVVKDFKIIFKGREVTDVKMELSALGSAYMVAGSLRVPKGNLDLRMGPWLDLKLEADILAVAERSL